MSFEAYDQETLRQAIHREHTYAKDLQAELERYKTLIEKIHSISEMWGTTGCDAALKKIYEMTVQR